MFKKVSIFLAIIFYIGCSQKYDDGGFSAITNPDQYPVLDTISIELTDFDSIYIANRYTQVNMTKDNEEFLYLGNKVVDGDTTLNLDILFAFALVSKDTTIDSITLRFPIFNDQLPIEDPSFTLSTINSIWEDRTTADSVEHRVVDLEEGSYTTSLENSEDTPTIGTNDLVITIDPDSIKTWYQNAVNGGDERYFYGLSLKSNDGMEDLFKLYSSDWGFSDLRPRALKYYSDSENDSTWVDSIYISSDLNIGEKKISPVETGFRVDGFTGEGKVIKFNMDTIFAHTGYEEGEISTISARLSIHKLSDDSIFGGLEKLGFYFVDDSLWYDEKLTKLNVDLDNPWQKSVADSGYTYVDLESFIDKWLNDRGTNNGVYVRSYSNNQPFSNSIFDKIKLEITYLRSKED